MSEYRDPFPNLGRRDLYAPLTVAGSRSHAVTVIPDAPPKAKTAAERQRAKRAKAKEKP
jgi:hypothetical protein